MSERDVPHEADSDYVPDAAHAAAGAPATPAGAGADTESKVRPDESGTTAGCSQGDAARTACAVPSAARTPPAMHRQAEAWARVGRR